MEDDLNYTTVIFKTKMSTLEKPNDQEIIYDEVKTEEQTWDTTPVIQVNEKKAPLHTPLKLVAAALGIICVILVSVVIALSIHFNTVISEKHRENTNLTAQNQQLWTEKTDLERRTEELTRDRDGLNWTMGAILEYENFPVKTHCPQKVCKPCLDGWVLFQSHCYLFTSSDYYYDWKDWSGSRDFCRERNAQLVVIGSQEEQEFINNHTKQYDDEKHGYWIGLREESTWTWIDGSNLTVTYWIEKQIGYRGPCALTLAGADPLANWNTAGCNMRNRRICETRTLIKPD
ncbi:C-type lectin domain family 4 member M-like [Scomber japonicus]|uniref:C-type lectin domain family 4 member M-like n=1 Tax=Scomber japonicus TaxID=13676 RepID=UPI0023054965|nr:C-type lectin domain family 4 member M-like [Scomber japonicus]